jgi:hypothetical protein
MYVIYPCDELIAGLIAREYSPVEEQLRRRTQQRQQTIVPNLRPEDDLFLNTINTTAVQSPTVQAFLPQKSAEIEKLRPDPVRPPRASRSKSKQTSNKKDSQQEEEAVVLQSKKQKPKRSVSFTAVFRSRSKDKDNKTPTTPSILKGSCSSLQKVAPVPSSLPPKPGFFSSGGRLSVFKSKEKIIDTDNNLLTHQGENNNGVNATSTFLTRRGNISVPRITFALEQEDQTFANYRGQNYHPSTPSTAPAATTSTSSGSSSKRPPLPKLALSGVTHNSINSANTTPPLPTPSGNIRGGSVPRGLILSTKSNSPAPGGGRKNSNSPSLPQPQSANPLSARKNSPFGRGSSELNNSNLRMAGLGGINGGSISGSLLTLGVGHGAHGGGGHASHGGAGSGGAQVIDANSLKDCAHPSLNENLKAHNALSFQVIRIGESFSSFINIICIIIICNNLISYSCSFFIILKSCYKFSQWFIQQFMPSYET